MDLSLLDRPKNVTEMRCPSAFCVLPERVEAALQSQTDRISRFVCFLTFPSVTFVIERVERNMEILVLMSKERPAFGRGLKIDKSLERFVFVSSVLMSSESVLQMRLIQSTVGH